MRATSPAVAAVFDPVQSVSTFEETVERLGTGIRLGLLPPGSQLPPERDLAEQMGISRSTLRQALTALTQSGHLVAVRGRGGGRFVADAPPMPQSSRVDLDEDRWRDLLDYRVAVECGAVVLAAERATAADAGRLRQHVAAMRSVDDFAEYRQADVFFHLALAEAARSPRLVAAMTEVQGGMSELIGHIPHPPEVLAQSNAQHAQLVTLVERGEAGAAAQLVREHVQGTRLILAGLMA